MRWLISHIPRIVAPAGRGAWQVLAWFWTYAVVRAWRSLRQAWAWCGAHRELVVLCPAGILVASAGPFSRWFQTEIEYWFAFAAGLTNAVAFWDIKSKLFAEPGKDSPAWVRVLLLIELLFLLSVLGVDVRLASGRSLETPARILTIVCVIIPISHLAVSQKRRWEATIPWLLIALLLLLLPFFKSIWSFCDGAFRTCELWQNVIRVRLYPGVHLLLVPFVYCLVDHLATIRDPEARDFLFLDKSLLGAGVACAFCGFFLAHLTTPGNGTPDAEHGSAALYESGAAAVVLLLGNSWYLSIRRQQEQHEHHEAAAHRAQTGNGQNPQVDGARLGQS